MFSLKDKTAIITGGGSGIGKAIAKLFAQQQADVHILDFDKKGADETTNEITAEGNRAQAIQCDVSNQQQVRSIIETIATKNKRIDILVNNAGVAHVGTIETTSEEDFNRLMNVNVKGVYNCLKSVIPFMKENGDTILNMASIAATVGIPDG